MEAPLDQCGRWEVYAYIAYINNGKADATGARYKIKHRNGTTPAGIEEQHVVNLDAVNQGFGQSSDRWQSLGTYLWSASANSAGEYVLLGDTTGVNGQSVIFDDMRWVYRGADDAACNPDITPPTGGYTEPANNTFVKNSVTLRGTASDDKSGVDHVIFTAFYDGSWHTVYTDNAAPYEYTWDMSGIADQGITLGYDVHDKAGNVALAPEGTRQITKAQGLLAPSKVQELSSSQNRLTLQWQDNSNNEDGFRIYRWHGEDLSWLARRHGCSQPDQL